MDPENDDLVAQFVNITGANTADAVQYLEMSEGDMQRAVDLYLDMGSTANQAASSENTGASSTYNSNLFQEEVREAIPSRYDQLIGGNQAPFEALQGWLQGHHPQANIPSLAELEAQAAQDEFEEAGLGSLYKPPDDINASGSLQEAMKRAKESKKWLLVNIQAADEFASHVLNRDVWSNETVKEVIRSSFLFWQREKGSQQGGQVVANYNLTQFPVVLIIDPRTGRKVKQYTSDKLKGPLSATDVFSDFMGENPYVASSVATASSYSTAVEEVVEVLSAPIEKEDEKLFEIPQNDLASPGAPDEVKIAIRLSSGQKKQVSFKALSPLTCVRQWVSATEHLPVNKFEIRLSHPPRVLDMNASLTVGSSDIAGALLVVALVSS